jgi:hypothetical protein
MSANRCRSRLVLSRLLAHDPRSPDGILKESAQLLNEMRASGVITNYALFDAIAQMRYTAPVATLDADFLITVPSPDRLDLLAPVYEFCRQRGLQPEGETIRVGAWPVQFVPAFSPLTMAAMETADVADFEGVPLRVVRADYLAVIALSTGRGKDFARVLALLESGHVTRGDIALLADRFGFGSAWTRFETRFLHG